MKLNSTTKLRITTEMKTDIKDISNKLGFKESDLCRYLLNRAIQQLKADSIKAGGYDKLSFKFQTS